MVLAFENNILYKKIILFLLISILGQVDFILVLSKSKGPGHYKGKFISPIDKTNIYTGFFLIIKVYPSTTVTLSG